MTGSVVRRRPLWLLFTAIAVAAIVAAGYAIKASHYPSSAWLYLAFTDTTTEDVAKTPTVTWLHPKEKPSGMYEEAFMPGHERDHVAFAFTITATGADGYTVQFQRIDPETEQPLDIEPIHVAFRRSASEEVRLTPATTVESLYRRSRHKDGEPPW